MLSRHVEAVFTVPSNSSIVYINIMSFPQDIFLLKHTIMQFNLILLSHDGVMFGSDCYLLSHDGVIIVFGINVIR